jgi:hypothetical protein
VSYLLLIQLQSLTLETRLGGLNVVPCTMFSITVHHVQYHRASCLVLPCTTFSITLYLPTLVQYTVYTKSHISYRSKACRCYTKCTVHQIFASNAITLPGSIGVVRSEPYGKQECRYKCVRNKCGPQKSLDISACTQI